MEPGTFCTQCGRPLAAGSRFCAHCGTAAATPPGGAANELEALAREALARGDKIAAIKTVRERTGLGLKEAKDWVENVARGMPADAPPSPRPAGAIQPSRLGCSTLVVGLLALLAALG